ncbi:hypothetical protein BD310DRAFT_182142 [Dichomitus squalens]|uniref:Uncharacterized protein n=1 Tax=Dichomitus squalens TaxID=114155 RepID=A0A4Q9PDT4_9APHY|nr:hypothetical protein BD310DRAFT_182142 [Dichomitus squalens]
MVRCLLIKCFLVIMHKWQYAHPDMMASEEVEFRAAICVPPRLVQGYTLDSHAMSSALFSEELCLTGGRRRWVDHMLSCPDLVAVISRNRYGILLFIQSVYPKKSALKYRSAPVYQSSYARPITIRLLEDQKAPPTLVKREVTTEVVLVLSAPWERPRLPYHHACPYTPTLLRLQQRFLSPGDQRPRFDVPCI